MISWLIESLVGLVLGFVAKIILSILALCLGNIGISQGSKSLSIFTRLFFGENDYKTFMIFIFGLAAIIIVVNFLIGLFRNIFTDDQNTPNPTRLAFNTIKTAFMTFCCFPIMNLITEVFAHIFNAFGGNSLLATIWLGIGSVDSKSLAEAFFTDMATSALGLGATAAGLEAAGSVVQCLIAIIVYILLLIQIMKFIINYVERYVFLGILYTFAPVALATGNNPSWEQTSKTFIKMFFSQLILICLSQLWISLIASGLMSTGIAGEVEAAVTSLGRVGIAGNSLMLLAFCKIGNSLDGYLGQLGLNAAQMGAGITGAMRDSMGTMQNLSQQSQKLAGRANSYAKMRQAGAGRAASLLGSGIGMNNGIGGFLAGKALGKVAQGSGKRANFASEVLAGAAETRKNQSWGNDRTSDLAGQDIKARMSKSDSDASKSLLARAKQEGAHFTSEGGLDKISFNNGEEYTIDKNGRISSMKGDTKDIFNSASTSKAPALPDTAKVSYNGQQMQATDEYGHLLQSETLGIKDNKLQTLTSEIAPSSMLKPSEDGSGSFTYKDSLGTLHTVEPDMINQDGSFSYYNNGELMHVSSYWASDTATIDNVKEKFFASGAKYVNEQAGFSKSGDGERNQFSEKQYFFEISDSNLNSNASSDLRTSQPRHHSFSNQQSSSNSSEAEYAQAQAAAQAQAQAQAQNNNFNQ